MNYTNGGLKLTDIEMFLNSIKGSWVKRLLTENNNMWKCMYDTILNKYGGELLFESNLQTQDIKRICKDNEFLKNIIQ